MRRPACNLITLVIYTCAVVMLTGIALYGANEYLTTSKIADTKSTVANYATAVSQYRFEIGEYPDNLTELTKKGNKDVDGNDASHFGPWLNKIEKDAWDKDFVYETLKTGVMKQDLLFILKEVITKEHLVIVNLKMVLLA